MCLRIRNSHGRAYNRTTYVEEHRKMMQAWADYLDRLKEPSGLLLMSDSATTTTEIDCKLRNVAGPNPLAISM